MKIGIDATALATNRTGIGNYVYPVLDELAKGHPESTFILYSNDSIQFPEYNNIIFRVSRPKRRGPFWYNTHLLQMLMRDRPTVFWGANGLLPLVKLKTTATIATIHDMVYRFAPQTMPWKSRLSRRLMQPLSGKTANRLVVNSKATGSDVLHFYGRQPHAVVPPLPSTGLARATFNQIEHTKRKFNLPPHYLLTLGTLEPRKNLEPLISAYLSQRKTGMPLPTLILAGGKGWLDKNINALIAEGKRDGLIQSLGYVKQAELPGLYAGC